jgi:predicted Zn-ribbon and HTH transcriptional regulator
MLSPLEARRHLSNGGFGCPYCASEDVSRSFATASIDADPNDGDTTHRISLPCHCNHCRSDWLNSYRLEDVRELFSSR